MNDRLYGGLRILLNTPMNTSIDTQKDPKPGVYRHYKGNLYEVLGTATHSETDEQLVVYRCLYGEFGLWVRPLAMFQESVVVDGCVLPRFSPVDDVSQ